MGQLIKRKDQQPKKDQYKKEHLWNGNAGDTLKLFAA